MHSTWSQRHQNSGAVAAKLSARLFVQVPVAVLRLICAPFARLASDSAFRMLALKGILRIGGRSGAEAGTVPTRLTTSGKQHKRHSLSTAMARAYVL